MQPKIAFEAIYSVSSLNLLLVNKILDVDCVV